MGTPAKAPIGSRWTSIKPSEKVWVVIERKPFGVLEVKQEGRACFGSSHQHMFLATHRRLPDLPAPVV